MSIDTVVFDFGGVVVDWNPRHLFSKVIPDPAELDHFLTVVCPNEWHLQHDRGVSFAQTVPARQALFPQYAELIAFWGTRYPEMISRQIPGTEAVVDELDQLGIRLLGLTNLPAEVWPEFRADWPVVERFEGVLVSGQEGVIKPDPRIFAILVERFGLTPERTVFIDDVRPNVEAARTAGLHAVQFVDAPTLRRDLGGLGLDLATEDH